MKKIAALLASLCLICSVMVPTLANAAPKEVLPGVMRVYQEAYASFPGDDQTYLLGGWTGSAFIVSMNDNGEAVLVTNRHCVDSAFADAEIVELKNYGAKIEDVIYIVNDDKDHLASAEVIAISRKTDLALLRVKSLKDRNYVMKIWDGDPTKLVSNVVYTAGFPGASDGIKSEEAYYNLKSDVASITFADGIISRIIDAGETTDGEIIQHTSLVNHGNSGGPLLDETGNVIGVNTWTSDAGEQTYWSISNQELISFLKENGISYQVGVRVQKVDPALIAIAIAVALALVLLIVGIRQRKVNQQQSKQIEALLRKRLTQFTSIILPKKSQPVQPQKGLSEKPAPQSQNEPDERHALSSSGNNSEGRVLRCDTGALAGRSYPVNRKITIGRDPAQCDIALPKDTPNVSRVHCVLIYNDKGVTVRDENSTYGTYMDGKRITAGVDVPFHRGHKLGIGSADEQVFSLHTQH